MENPKLSETQRVELALLPQMFLAVLLAGASDTTHPDFLRTLHLLKTAGREAVSGMSPAAQVFVLNRVRRVHHEIEGKFLRGQRYAKIAAVLWYMLEDLLSQEVLELYEGAPLAEALGVMQPMFEYVFEEEKVDDSAKRQAAKVLRHLQSKRYYLAWKETAAPEGTA